MKCPDGSGTTDHIRCGECAAGYIQANDTCTPCTQLMERPVHCVNMAASGKWPRTAECRHCNKAPCMDCDPNVEQCRGHDGVCIGVAAGWNIPYGDNGIINGTEVQFFRKNSFVSQIERRLKSSRSAMVLECPSLDLI